MRKKKDFMQENIYFSEKIFNFIQYYGIVYEEKPYVLKFKNTDYCDGDLYILYLNVTEQGFSVLESLKEELIKYLFDDDFEYIYFESSVHGITDISVHVVIGFTKKGDK